MKSWAACISEGQAVDILAQTCLTDAMSKPVAPNPTRGYYVDTWGYLRDRNGIRRDRYVDEGGEWKEWHNPIAKGKGKSIKGKSYGGKNSKGSDVGLTDHFGHL
jgi:hypothetical protein